MRKILLPLNLPLHECCCWFLTFLYSSLFQQWLKSRFSLSFRDKVWTALFKHGHRFSFYREYRRSHYTHSSWHPPLQRSITATTHASLAPGRESPASSYTQVSILTAKWARVLPPGWISSPIYQLVNMVFVQAKLDSYQMHSKISKVKYGCSGFRVSSSPPCLS